MPPEEEWETGTIPMGECVEIPPCGEGRTYLNVHWAPMCVSPMVEADCPKGLTYKGEINECVFENTCPEGMWNIEGTCMPDSCEMVSADLVQHDAFMVCMCPENHHWDIAASACSMNLECSDSEYYSNRTDTCILKP